MTEKEKYVVHDFVKFDYSEIGEYIDEDHTPKPLRNDELVDILNTQLEIIEVYDKEILACYDTLSTIIALCDTVLRYDFEGIVLKDPCNRLIEMDNKDVVFLKECFEAIRDRDLKKMTSLTIENQKGKRVYGDVR